MNVPIELFDEAWDFYLRYRGKKSISSPEFCKFYGVTFEQHKRWTQSGKLHVRKEAYFKMLAASTIGDVLPAYMPAMLKALAIKHGIEFNVKK